MKVLRCSRWRGTGAEFLRVGQHVTKGTIMKRSQIQVGEKSAISPP